MVTLLRRNFNQSTVMSLVAHLLLVAILITGAFKFGEDQAFVPLELRIQTKQNARSSPILKKNSLTSNVMPLTPAQLETAQNSIPTENTSSSAITDELSLYIQKMILQINEVKHYPRRAVVHHEEGSVVASILVAPNGDILERKIEKHAAFEALNQAALEAIKKIQKLPSLPAQYLEPIEFKIPIEFKLQE